MSGAEKKLPFNNCRHVGVAKYRTPEIKKDMDWTKHSNGLKRLGAGSYFGRLFGKI